MQFVDETNSVFFDVPRVGIRLLLAKPSAMNARAHDRTPFELGMAERGM